MRGLAKAFEEALIQAAALPEKDQDQIGRQLLAHIEKLRRLRDDIDQGIRSLEAGESTPFDIEKFLAEQHAKHGRA